MSHFLLVVAFWAIAFTALTVAILRTTGAK